VRGCAFRNEVRLALSLGAQRSGYYIRHNLSGARTCLNIYLYNMVLFVDKKEPPAAAPPAAASRTVMHKPQVHREARVSNRERCHRYPQVAPLLVEAAQISLVIRRYKKCLSQHRSPSSGKGTEYNGSPVHFHWIERSHQNKAKKAV